MVTLGSDVPTISGVEVISTAPSVGAVMNAVAANAFDMKTSVEKNARTACEQSFVVFVNRRSALSTCFPSTVR